MIISSRIKKKSFDITTAAGQALFYTNVVIDACSMMKDTQLLFLLKTVTEINVSMFI